MPANRGAGGDPRTQAVLAEADERVGLKRDLDEIIAAIPERIDGSPEDYEQALLEVRAVVEDALRRRAQPASLRQPV
jgi:hypothetical protein